MFMGRQCAVTLHEFSRSKVKSNYVSLLNCCLNHVFSPIGQVRFMLYIHIVPVGRVCSNLKAVRSNTCITGKLITEISTFSKKKTRKKMKSMSLLVLLLGDR